MRNYDIHINRLYDTRYDIPSSCDSAQVYMLDQINRHLDMIKVFRHNKQQFKQYAHLGNIMV